MFAGIAGILFLLGNVSASYESQSLQITPAAHAPAIHYVDATPQSGLYFTHEDGPRLFESSHVRFGVGGAVADYDRDGDQDVYLCNTYPHPNRLFRNNGDGTFTEVAESAGVADRGYSHMALFLDLDNDGFDDLLVLNNAHRRRPQYPTSQLYRNDGDGTFDNVTEGSGFYTYESQIGGATAGDYDKDGDLDLFITGWFDRKTYFFRNDGDFTFAEVADEVGIRRPGTEQQWAPVFADFDNDGWQDVYCAVDFNPDYLYLNDRRGGFKDATLSAGVLHINNDMGVAVADIDDDLDLDIYTTNVSGHDFDCFVPHGCNMLYVNDGAGHFFDGTAASGLGHTWWGWGVWIYDADLDGDRDVLAVNGWMDDIWFTPANFFVNNGRGGFVERAADCGLAHVGNSRALLPLDHDNDGDLDMIVTDVLGAATLYENRSPRRGRHYLTVEVVGTASNRNGVGSRVYVTVGGRTQMHEIHVGGSFYAAPPLAAHFGLGRADVADEVQVVFPSGREVLLEQVQGSRRIQVTEPAPSHN